MWRKAGILVILGTLLGCSGAVAQGRVGVERCYFLPTIGATRTIDPGFALPGASGPDLAGAHRIWPGITIPAKPLPAPSTVFPPAYCHPAAPQRPA